MSSEAEANYWAYRACVTSSRPELRYAGLQSILPYVLTNAWTALPDDEYDLYIEKFRPEVLDVYKTEKQYWIDRTSPTVNRIHGHLYDLFLKSNRISSGRSNYNEVIRLILSLS